MSAEPAELNPEFIPPSPDPEAVNQEAKEKKLLQAAVEEIIEKTEPLPQALRVLTFAFDLPRSDQDQAIWEQVQAISRNQYEAIAWMMEGKTLSPNDVRSILKSALEGGETATGKRTHKDILEKHPILGDYLNQLGSEA